MSAIMGRYVKDGDMPSGAELCLECRRRLRLAQRLAGAARSHAALDLQDIHLHHAGGGEVLDPGCAEDEDLIWRYQLYQPYSPAEEG